MRAKFRVWDRLCKCYWYQGFAISPDGRVENLHGDIPKARIQAGWTIDKSYDSNLTGFDLEEFTGLKDKNGVEIFEGSLVKWTDSDGVVHIDDVKYGFAKFFLNNNRFSVYEYMSKELVVIGTSHDEDKKE